MSCRRRLCCVTMPYCRSTASDALINARLVGLFGSRQLYGRALACFYHIFSTIEDCLTEVWGRRSERGDVEMEGAKAVAALRAAATPAMRTRAFESDLAFYLGEGWRSEVGAGQPGMKTNGATHLEGMPIGPADHRTESREHRLWPLRAWSA